ncbi:MAG: VOC family protein [Rhodospirillales bacterium]|nr:VOC family protein [Rhodospirillales bacterium]
MTVGTPLDHAVINVKFEMDRAVPLFEGLGFTVTPRGYHSLGSINHLMIFGTDYLELIGLPAGIEKPRPEIANSPLGINGLVFKAEDVDSTYAHLDGLGLAGDAPMSFTRPVELGGEEHTARFRTVKVRPDTFPAGRVYFCEHGTPELVWRKEWSTHANGAVAIREFVVVAAEPEAAAARYADVTGAANITGDAAELIIGLGGARLSVLSPARYGERFGALALALGDRPSIFGAITISTDDLAAATSAVERSGLPSRVERDRVVVGVPDFEALIEFAA